MAEYGIEKTNTDAHGLADRAEVYTVGDCVEPREVLEAVREGLEAGLKL